MSEPVSFETLATYKAECERGIVHTPEWDARMADLQREFDARVEAMLEESRQPDGTILLPLSTPPAIWDAIARIREQIQ